MTTFVPEIPFGNRLGLFHELERTAKIRRNYDTDKYLPIKIINMAIKRTVIQIPSSAVQKISQSQGCKKSTVYAALNYSSFSENAKRIRQIALSEYGGIKTTKTYFD